MRDYFRNRQVLGSIRQLDVVVPEFFPKTGLVSYYKLDGNSNDSVGTNNGSDTSVSYVAGKIGNAASFNGSSSRITIPSNSSLNFGNGDRTISMWIKTSVGDKKLYSNRNDTVRWWTLGVGPSGQLSFEAANGYPTGYIDVKYGSGLTDNNWHNVVMVKSGGTVYFYIDNSLVGSTAWNYSADGSITTNYIGTNYHDGGFYGYFNGLIDEVGIWSRALTSDEITKLYNNGNGLTY
jgi:hypothetical protein